MGLFDSIAGEVMNNLGGNARSGGGSMLQLVMELLKQHGGLAGLLDLLKEHGLDRQVASWLGAGANLPVTGEQLTQALGSGPLAELAGKFGFDPQAIAGQLAQFLPEAVNQLTPGGQLPEGDTAIEQGLGALAGKLFG